MTIRLIDAELESRDQRYRLGSVAMEAPLDDIRLRLHFDFLTWGCAWQRENNTFSHPAPPFNRLFIFFGTRGEVRMGGKRYRLTAGKFYLLPEDSPFLATYFAGGELLFIHFAVTDQALHRVFAGLSHILTLDAPALATLFGELRHEAWNGELQSLTVNVIWRLLSPEIRRELVCRAGIIREFGPLFQWLENTPPAGVRIAEMAEVAGVTSGALGRKFQRRFGMTLKSFIAGRTLRMAQQLLLGGAEPVTLVAARLGFDDVHYFYHFFQRQVGCTPQEFRSRRQ